jgi:hypothetical protein
MRSDDIALWTWRRVHACFWVCKVMMLLAVIQGRSRRREALMNRCDAMKESRVVIDVYPLIPTVNMDDAYPDIPMEVRAYESLNPCMHDHYTVHACMHGVAYRTRVTCNVPHDAFPGHETAASSVPCWNHL